MGIPGNHGLWAAARGCTAQSQQAHPPSPPRARPPAALPAESAANYTHYRTRFASVAENAGANSGSGTAMFYSFDDGLAHFLLWDTEAFWSQPADSQLAMVNWIKADLAKANANRAAVPWVIALGHKAWYMDQTIDCPSGPGCAVWDLLTKGGVDMYVTGHIHQYQRSLPVYPNANNGTGAVDTATATNSGTPGAPAAVYTNPAYMTMVVTAAPGDQEVNRRRRRRAAAARTPDLGVQAESSNYGFSLLNVVNATHLHWTFKTAVPHINATYPAFTDDLWLVVDSHGPRTNLPPV